MSERRILVVSSCVSNGVFAFIGKMIEEGVCMASTYRHQVTTDM